MKIVLVTTGPAISESRYWSQPASILASSLSAALGVKGLAAVEEYVGRAGANLSPEERRNLDEVRRILLAMGE